MIIHRIKRIKICPKCNSTDIRLDPLFWGSRIYCCGKCGFRSPLFPETPIKEIEKKLKNKMKSKKRRKIKK